MRALLDEALAADVAALDDHYNGVWIDELVDELTWNCELGTTEQERREYAYASTAKYRNVDELGRKWNDWDDGL